MNGGENIKASLQTTLRGENKISYSVFGLDLCYRGVLN